MISGLYAAVLALIQIKLTLDVVGIRRGQKISIGNGGREDLERKMRVHGNFIETVPIALLLMLIAELSGSPLWCIHILGLMMVGGRIAHAIGLNSKTGHGKFRFYGMVTTVTVIVLGAFLCLWLAWPVLFAA